jgi:DNA polymerase-1
MKRVMIVDAHNQYLRAYISDPSTSYNGDHIGGICGFLKVLNTLCRKIKPDEIIVVWDGAGGSQKRRSANKNYKMGRKPLRLNRVNTNFTSEEESDSKIRQQLRSIEYLNCSPIIQFMEAGIEADDVIAFVCRFTKYKNYQKVIVSSDKDFIQLLDDTTVLYRPTQKEVLNKKNVVEKHGIHPNNFALARAIAGDPSDGLKGVRGVGLPTVAKRFSFLAEEKDYNIYEVLKYCQTIMESAKIKVYENILLDQQTIASNYGLMQLSSPSISPQTKSKIKAKIKDFVPMFNKTQFRSMMSKDGFGQITLVDLFVSFNNAVTPK